MGADAGGVSAADNPPKRREHAQGGSTGYKEQNRGRDRAGERRRPAKGERGRWSGGIDRSMAETSAKKSATAECHAGRLWGDRKQVVPSRQWIQFESKL